MHKTSFAAALSLRRLSLPQLRPARSVSLSQGRSHDRHLESLQRTFASWITDFNNQSKDTSTLEPGSSVIVFRANLNRGSDAPACNTPKYELETISADQLFNGRLNNPTQDAKEIGLDQ